MRSALTLLLAIVLSATLSSAWPWPRWTQISTGSLERRQNGGNNNNNGNNGGNNNANNAKSAAPTASSNRGSTPSAAASGNLFNFGSTATSGSVTAKATGNPSSGSNSAAATQGSNSNSGSGSGSHPTNTKTSGKKSAMVTGSQAAASSIADTDPPGGIEMLTPAARSTTYYKIGEDVTLVWNYTSLIASPTAVNVIASNTAGIWTLTQNASVQQTGRVVWKTNQDKGGSNPLLTDTYTLVVYDTQAGLTGVPRPGHLSSYLHFQFGMYLPQAYTPLSGFPKYPTADADSSDFVCATCNGALSPAEQHTLGFLVGMGLVTVLSFGWFANGFMGGF